MSILLNKYLVKEPQRSYKWRLTLPQIPRPVQRQSVLDVLSGGSGMATRIAGDDLVNVPSINIEAVNFPLPYTDAAEWVGNGSKKKYALSVESIDPLEVEFLEVADGDTLRAIVDWKLLIQNPDGTFNYPQTGAVPGYKNDIVLDLTSGFNTVHTRIVFEGCWPSTTESIGLSYADASSRVLYRQQFSVDKMSVFSRGFLGQFGIFDEGTPGGRSPLSLPNGLDNLRSLIPRLGG